MTRRRRVLFASLAGIALVIPIGVVAAARIPFSSDTLRVRLIDALEDRLAVDAELSDLTLRFHPRLRAVGTGLVLRSTVHPDAPPLIEVARFTVDADLAGLWNRQVSYVKLEGLSIQIPPDEDAEVPTSANRQPSPEPEQSDYLKQVVIRELEAPDSKLSVLRSDPAKAPRTWLLHKLRLQHVSFSSRMPFDTVLTNAIPPGEIQAAGTFGPWHPAEPGETPLDGDFTFDHADLSVFDGIGGILAARGAFKGTLDRIDINGKTDTPDFTVDISGHKVPLTTTYHAIVDATNGNTMLDPVEAHFLSTSVTARGGVYEDERLNGRVIRLDLSIDDGQLQDIMRLAVRTPRAPMTGRLSLATKFVIPPGRRDIVDKLQLDGQFSIQGGRFTDNDVQKKVNELSRRASVKAQEVANQRNVGSNFSGRFRLGNGRLALPTVSFDVPGAVVQLHGQYGMKREDFAFDGNLYMDAKISQTTTGIKSLLLKAIDPLFRRNGRTVVPVRITGSRSDPKFGVNVGRVLRRSSRDDPRYFLVDPAAPYAN